MAGIVHRVPTRHSPLRMVHWDELSRGQLANSPVWQRAISVQAMLRARTPQPPTWEGSATAGHEERREIRILVVEDEARLALLLRRGLEEEGHAVDLAADGEEALAWIDAYPASYDAIVLDVMLPGVDGLEVCRRLRRARLQFPILL